MSYPICHEAPTTCNDSVAKATAGKIYRYDGDLYKYVQFKDAVTYASGQSLEWADTARTSVTNDRAGGSSLGRIAAGICKCVMTQNYYGYMAITGTHTIATSGADDIAVGESVFTHATTDGTVDGASASTYSTGEIGVALEADDNAANTVIVELRNLV